MLSTSSSPDPSAICECGHPHANHTSERCTVCDAQSSVGGFMHTFRRKAYEPPKEAVVDVELPEPQSQKALCICGHEHCDHLFSKRSQRIRCVWELCPCLDFRLDLSRPGPPEPEADGKPEVTEAEVDQMMAAGEPVEVVSSNDRCACGHKRKKHHGILGCHRCYAKGLPNRFHAFELAPLECEGGCIVLTEPPAGCSDSCQCGGEWWAHGCKHSLPPQAAPEEGPPCSEVEGCDGLTCGRAVDPIEEELAQQEAAFEAAEQAARAALNDEWAPLPRVPRRPPYAVAYAIQDGHVYEIALPGDATVIAEDGVLKISHPGAVLALVQARPMEVPDDQG